MRCSTPDCDGDVFTEGSVCELCALAQAQAEVRRLRAALEGLRAGHAMVCNRVRYKGEPLNCSCGADQRNKRIDEILDGPGGKNG